MSLIYVLTPTFRPVGGVVKVFDYALHAMALGHEPVICCPELYEPGLPLFAIERFAALTPEGGTRYIRGFAFGVEPDDLVFFSWPEHYSEIASRLSPGIPLERVIHIIQNTRHANPLWVGGYATRLLSRPMARIMVTQETLDACLPFLNPRSLTRAIPEGHDWEYFHRQRQGGLPDPISVGYTTWKSGVGVRVEESLAGDRRFRFRSIRSTVAWPELRDLYHWADVFLGTPGPEEGFYLVGLEALAAGALLVTADAGGNRAYSRFGENCLQVDLDSETGYRDALERLRAMGEDEVVAMRQAGYRILENHTLEKERILFAEFLAELEARPARPDLEAREG